MSVYILDWLDNKDKVVSRIKSEIESAVERKRHPEAKKEEYKPKQEIVFETEEVQSFE